MAAVSADKPFTSSPNTRAAFSNYLKDHPNNRRVSRVEREELIGWLTGCHAPPTSQKEFSRRNYVRNTFAWDQDNKILVAAAARNGAETRKVIIEDDIIDVVELVHTSNGHPGWDATWREVSRSYYGILRADTIFLLKRCSVCALNPRKRPKGYVRTAVSPDSSRLTDDDSITDSLNADDKVPSMLDENGLFDFLDAAVPQCEADVDR